MSLFRETPDDRPLYYFEQLSAVPRPSGGEQRVSDFILRWAQERGLDAYQDEHWNLILRKPASPGREGCPPVILQAHLDMVCEKNSDSAHNFETDPIRLTAEGDWLRSACGTTLGADDGIGVAYCMAALADEALVHPPLEVILTVQEESTFCGAKTLDWSRLRGKRLINLDHSDQNTVLCGSCGGTGLTAEFPLKREPLPEGWRTFALRISGLVGGHSGEDIHRGRGSANQLLTRALRALEPEGVRLVGIEGGAFRLAIPREAEALLAAPAGCAERLRARVEELEGVFRREYAAAAPELRVTLEQRQESPARICTAAGQRRTLEVLTLFPDGIQQMNGAVPGVVESSINLGVVRLEEDRLTLTAEIRGGYESTVEEVAQKVRTLAGAFDGRVEFFDRYTPWQYRAESPLRASAQAVYAGLFGRELEPAIVHAGLECGCFLADRPELDAVSLGPDCQYFHSPLERMSLRSAREEWRFLRALLTALAQ